jgi:arylsulfatase A-like enzyme
MTGHHRPNGILLIHGPGVTPGARVETASIVDVTPTVLWLSGQPIPAEMDGKALTGVFAHDWQASHPVEITDRSIDRAADDAAYSAEDEDTIRERLKGLGYAG